jgi:hypothetical protein
MTPRLPHVLASAALGLTLIASPSRLRAAESHELDFAGAKTKAAESGKLVLVDFSSPT